MRKKYTYEYIKEQIEKEGYKLLSKTYIGALNNLNIQCNKGHKYKSKWSNFQQGYRCRICFVEKRTYDYKFIKKQIEKEGYKLLNNNYVNNKTKLEVQCNKGHKYKVSLNSFQKGCRCPICDYTKTISKDEKEILDIIKQLLPNENIIENDRTQIVNPLTSKNLELDIYIPLLNKAIEYNGKYWHNNDYSRFKDNIKVKQCKEKNINLLVINEKDWLDNKEKYLVKIKDFINE